MATLCHKSIFVGKAMSLQKVSEVQKKSLRMKVVSKVSEEKVDHAVQILPRREAVTLALLAGPAISLFVPAVAQATPKRTKVAKIDPSLYREIPGTDPPIMYYDLKGSAGTEGGVKKGQRAAVHFDVKWKGLTVATSRQGMGVTGGVPYGFEVGIDPGNPGGPFIKAFNEGVAGMQVGTVRTMIVPPEYAYGSRGVQEIPPNATLQVDLELLSIKKDNVFG
mmetsp:Transcript_27828/g.38462  ORF Transcript_27828/g.38462 Transcript_27828/m.38462 type:complete len:221 (+) Transcript_27828:149-811(+)